MKTDIRQLHQIVTPFDDIQYQIVGDGLYGSDIQAAIFFDSLEGIIYCFYSMDAGSFLHNVLWRRQLEAGI